MADERYEWLDQDAAERLLRGEPVEPVGIDARHQALRLAELLDGARAQGPVAEPLRGEDAALAAFRKARDGGAAELLPTVRLTPETRQVSWGRSVRWGLAASLAGLAVGGVAVAAGVGVLPTPFGGPQPAPASSVSGAVTPGPVTSEPSTDGLRSPDRPSPADAPPSPSAPAASGGTDTPGGPGDGPSSGPGRVESTAPHDGRTDGDTYGRDWYRKTVDACRDYRNGTLDEERKRKLEAAAQGADRVKRFCDRMLAADGEGDSGGDGGDKGGDGGPGGGGDDGDDGGDGSGSGGFPRSPFLPPTSVRPGPAQQPFVPPTDMRPAFRPAVSGASVPGSSLPTASAGLPVGGGQAEDGVRTLSIASL
ncbi:hypothetical protein [Streptomyces wuyuanensis]|uniref:Uncharacterized protein n=1 Tax=Streptomyces wuyuanensis TaxID=1196353 RepID=A0A1G9NRR6_9ACTN|nr:hypothetical protein [Streptomyces wuyuanensis]SDL89003.1 hypothetical protein SAMN05444921_10260 [Streptomyces wuyuanensis]